MTTPADLVAYFENCGLAPNRAADLVNNPKNSTPAHTLFVAAGLENKGLNDKQNTLVLTVAAAGTKVGEKEKLYAVDAVVDGRLKAIDQVTAAIKYLSANPLPVDQAAFDSACGVGFTSTSEETIVHVQDFFKSNKTELTKSGWKGIGSALGKTKSDSWLKWANGLEVKQALEAAYTEAFGSKQSVAAAAKPLKEVKPNTPKAVAVVEEPVEDMFSTGWLARLHKPGENPQIDPKLKEEHLRATGGKVFTRFPPEPNGFLHIGHSKAIAVNFGYAKHHQGHCYLRFDDTNPEAEEQVYFDKILEAVRWLGYEPYKITYSSDHFQELFDLAIQLIKSRGAYTSNDTAADISEQRGGKDHRLPRTESKDRNKPVEQSLLEFEAMRAGKYEPGQMTLRMKQDMTSGNPVMWDTIAYRVLKAPHHRTGDKWCIYPTYDFTHCLCDSFENISHSLCTAEFIGARTSYEWLCDALKMYKPRQSEYGRMNLEGSVMSKRKLLKLVVDKHVSGWDDPRLYTLVALKRRGVPPTAITTFVSSLGVSVQASQIPLNRFEQVVRSTLETTTPRLMMVLKPIRVTIENLSPDFLLDVTKDIHPKDPSMGTNTVPFTRTIFIESDDFRPEADKDFYRLAPGARVGLLNVPFPISYVSHTTNPTTGAVDSIICKYEASVSPKPKAYIHWVAEHLPSGSPVKISEARIFTRLFKSDNPAALGDAYVQDIDPNSLTVVSGALIETGIWKIVKDSLANAAAVVEERKKEAAKVGIEAPPSVDGMEVIRFQGTRVAYFALDQDSRLGEVGMDKGEGEIVLNMIAPLKQDAGKRA